MKELTKILEEMLEDTIKLIDNCSNSSQEQNKWRDNFLSKYENTKDYPLKTAIMALAIHHGDDAILHNRIRRTVRLLEMNLIVSAALNKAIGKIENEFPKEMKTIKSELQSEVQATLGAIHAKYEEEKKIDEEINKAAQEREWAKDLYG